MNNLLEKAQQQLEGMRGKETASIQAFQMLKQGLTDAIKFGNKEKDESHTSKSESEESKAVAEGDLSATSKDLAEDTKSLADLHHNCMTKASDYEAETTSRGEELKALATAKKIIKETTGGASDQSYSFLQMPESETRAVRFIRELAKKQGSMVLSQLASRMSSTVRFSAGTQADIFAKVKGLITDMIEKLEAEAEADATKKAYCDKELAETNQKKDDKSAEIEKLSAKIESSKAKSNKLKEQVATLQSELATLTREQAQMDKIRAQEKSDWENNSAEMEKGLNGIKMALKVLNEYYAKADKAHDSSDGASTGIIGLLEVCESDFSKGLAEMNAAEDAAARAYDQQSKENKIDRATKDQDVKYKSKEISGLGKSLADSSSDRTNIHAELDAVVEYLGKLGQMCIAKAEPYAERAARREAEIQGLKEAISILEGNAVLLQRTRSHSRKWGTLRGAARHLTSK